MGTYGPCKGTDCPGVTWSVTPPFWSLISFLTDLKGTMSLNEIAADLTCAPEEFEPATTDYSDTAQSPMPGTFAFPSLSQIPLSSASSTMNVPYHVHSGMLRMARAMGDAGKPVQLAVQTALHNNPDYGSCMFKFLLFSD